VNKRSRRQVFVGDVILAVHGESVYGKSLAEVRIVI
jgi:hypothetical protein